MNKPAEHTEIRSKRCHGTTAGFTGYLWKLHTSILKNKNKIMILKSALETLMVKLI